MKKIRSKNNGNYLKRVIISIVAGLSICVLIIILYVTYQAIHLEFWRENTQSDVKVLSKKEKIEDFEYLTQYVRDVYPYNDAIVKYKFLDDIRSQEKDYIARAGSTNNNSEFFQMVYEYVQRLRQGDGHIDVYFGRNQSQNNNFLQYYLNNIRKSTYFKTDYWGNEAAKFKWYAFSDMNVVYKNGKYILNKDYKFSDIVLPEGTMIEKVDGMKTDDYVKSLQNKTRLLLDTDLNKNFITNLFSIDSDTGCDTWTVDFRLKDGAVYTGELRKLNVNVNTANSLGLYNYSNIECRELDGDIGYIRIFTFYQQYIKEDNEVIQNFMKASNGKYKKLIIDIRGNVGGELNYWGENIVRPLLKKPETLVQYSAIRKGFFDWMGIRYYLFRWLIRNDLLQKDLNHIDSIKKTAFKEFSDKDWYVFKITKNFTPQNSFPFSGKVYILTDQDTFSAGDSFAAAAKNMKLGEVIGTNTGGGGNLFMAPVEIALPNSQIMLRMNVELTLNDRNQPDQIFGTAPDVALQPSTYPTENPYSLEINDLVKDAWISWVIND